MSEMRTAVARVPTASSVAVFDVDGTLYSINTLYDFLERFHAARSRCWWAFFRSARTLPGKLFWALVTRVTPGELLRRLAFRSLRGVDETSLDAACRAYIRDVLPAHAVEEVVALLRECRELGYTVLIVSGSIAPLVREISQALDADGWLAADPVTVDHRFTGAIAGDARGRKLAVVEQAYPEIADLVVVTDNREDLPLIRRADRAWVVSRSKNLTWWRSRALEHATLIERP